LTRRVSAHCAATKG